MSGTEPPPTEARLLGWLLQYFPPILYKVTFLNVPLKRSPAGSVPVNRPNHMQTVNLPQKKDLFIMNTCLWHERSECRYPGEKFG